MESQQLHADRQHLVYLGAALINVGHTLQGSHGELFASQFVEEYGSAIEHAAQRLWVSRGAKTEVIWKMPISRIEALWR